MKTIVPLMIGTAGHVDHGKTSLVRALTNYETDRHKEEKLRGVSIDFAVAPFVLDDGSVAGIIDLPGHTDYLRNMIAGAADVDLLLLVVAADDGVMPQTREHLRILSLLGVKEIFAVITKCDLVAPDLLDLVQAEVAELLASQSYPNSTILKVSALSGEGVPELRAFLEQRVLSLKTTRKAAAFRMNVRMAFSIKGQGTVVTGIPSTGSIKVGGQLELLPSGRKLTVRSIEQYREQLESSVAGASCALNLRDISVEDLSRGMVLSAPGAYRSAKFAVVLFNKTSRPELKLTRKQLFFHSGTQACVCRAREFQIENPDNQSEPNQSEANQSEPNQSQQSVLRLHFTTAPVLAPGDRFILRSSGSGEILGGGLVLAIAERARRKLGEVLAEVVKERENLFLTQLLCSSKIFFSKQELLTESAMLADNLSEHAEDLIRQELSRGTLLKLTPTVFTLAARISELSNRLKKALQTYHRNNPYQFGMKPSYVCKLLALPNEAFDALFKLIRSADLVLKHSCLALSTFEPPLSARELELRGKIISQLEKAGKLSLARGTLVELCGMSATELKTLTKLLLDEGQIVIVESNFLLKSIYEEFRQTLCELFRSRDIVSLADFREASGASRNVAAAVLDSFDAEGLTKRVESGRVLCRAER